MQSSVLLRAGMLELVWRLSYAIILVLISFMVLWRIFRVKESAQWKKRNAGALRCCCARKYKIAQVAAHMW